MVPLYAFIHSYIHIANIFSKFSAVTVLSNSTT